MKKFNLYKMISAALLLLLAAYGVLSPQVSTQLGATFPCNGKSMTEAQIAEFRGISLVNLQRLETRFEVSPADICTLPKIQLDQAVNMVKNGEVANKEAEEEREVERETANEKIGEQPDLKYLRMRLQDENGNIPLDGLVKAKAQMDRMARLRPSAAGIASNGWTWLGPGNIGGRTRAIAIDPTDTNVVYAGTASGGVWKTTDGGASWFVLDDFMGVLGIGSLVMDPNDHNTLYAGTGEVFQGNGIFKTTDAGATWTQLASTNNSNFTKIPYMAISSTYILAATNTGIWKSSDGGTTWTQKNSTPSMQDVRIDPNNATKAVASSYNNTEVLYSTNSGETWNTSFFNGGALALGWYNSVQLAYARGTANLVYGAVNKQVWKSADGGANFMLVSTQTDPDFGSGEYMNGIWVDPTNSNHVIIGVQDNWRSTDGGVTFNRISEWWNWPISAHADNHFILEDPGFNGTTNTKVYVANDGGMWRADNIYTVMPTSGWTNLNNNLGNNQFYSGAGNAISGQVIGGTQDTGSLSGYTSGDPQSWTTITGGDGGFTAIDPADPAVWYGEYIFLNGFTRSGATLISGEGGPAGGSGWKDAPYRIDDAMNKTANFIAPFILDPNNSNRMLAGGASLWRTNDVKAPVTDTTGPEWYAIKSPGADNISAITVAPGNSDIIWVGYNNGDIFMTTDGTATTPAWTKVDTTTPSLPDRYVGRITIDKNNNNTVYAVFGGYSPDNVYVTTDGGANWSDITGSGLSGLPDLPVYSLVIHPNNSNWLYLGTELGIFTSEDSGANWTLPHDGPVNTGVEELFWLNNTLVAATHGRGMFKTSTDVPAVQRITGTPTGPTSVNFTVTFNKTVRNVDLGDFNLTTTDTAAGNLSGLSGSGNTYTVSVDSISGVGSLRLDVPLAASVNDVFGVALAGLPYTDGRQCIVSATGIVCPIVVVSQNDSGAGSLRQAIVDAPAGSIIAFDPSLNGQTIFLAHSLIIDKNLTVDGALLSSKVTISGDSDNNGTGDVRVMTVNSGANVKINGLTISKGFSGEGGGLHNEGTLTVTNSAFIGNSTPPSAADGGAIWNRGVLTVANSTFYGNTASNVGGAIYSGTTFTLLNSTLSGNNADWGGGLAIDGTTILKNTIIANSTGGDCGAWTDPVTNIKNLIQDGGCSPTYTGDPKLAALADNGAPTQTMALQPDSPAINMGDDATCAADPVSGKDQRGTTRPQGVHCDIGAFEWVDTVAPSVVSFTRLNPSIATTNADTLTFRATFSENVSEISVQDFVVNSSTAGVSGLTSTGSDGNWTKCADENGSCDFMGSTKYVRFGANGVYSYGVFTDLTNCATYVFGDPTPNVLKTCESAGVVSSNVFDITVSGGNLANFNGTVGLDLDFLQNIKDITGNALPLTEPATDQAYTLDNTAPNTTIGTTKPTNPTLLKTASFSFSGTDSSGIASFQCKLDAGAYAACTSPKAYTAALAFGTHTFSVRAIDKAGNVDATPATYTWQVWGERALNGGFEKYPTSGNVKIPTLWTPVNFDTTKGDGKDTTAGNHKDGLASVKISGNGKVKTLTQIITLAGTSADKLTFSYWVKGSSLPTNGLCQAQVIFLNLSNVQVGAAKTVACGTVSSTFTQKTSLTFNAPGTFAKVKIVFTYSKASGTVWFDLASLLK